MSKVINFKKHYRYSLGDFWKYLEILEKALNGDLVLEVTPATTSNSVTTVNNEISAGSKLGYTISDATSVDTLTA